MTPERLMILEAKERRLKMIEDFFNEVFEKKNLIPKEIKEKGISGFEWFMINYIVPYTYCKEMAGKLK